MVWPLTQQDTYNMLVYTFDRSDCKKEMHIVYVVNNNVRKIRITKLIPNLYEVTTINTNGEIVIITPNDIIITVSYYSEEQYLGYCSQLVSSQGLWQTFQKVWFS